MLAYMRKGPIGVLLWEQTGMLQVQSGAMVDQPQALMPDQEVRVACCAVHVRQERIEPHDVGRQLRGGAPVGAGGIRGGARKEVDAEVGAGTRSEQLLDLRVRLGQTE